MDEKLYRTVEYILNTAGPAELEVIQAALGKRLTEKRGRMSLGLDPGKLASETAGQVGHQVEASKRMVKELVAGFASDIIRQNAPELDDAQVAELLSEFMPGMAGGRPSTRAGGPGTGDDSALPPGMIIQMVRQFLEYSEGSMSAGEQVQLEQDIPGWKEKYWKSFPGQVQKLISLYLNGEIDRQRLESHICEVLGI